MLIDPLILLQAYSIGVFPMSDDRDARDVYWVEPKYRAILPLEQFHLSHSLARVLRRDRFRVTANRAFGDILALCAQAAPDRPGRGADRPAPVLGEQRASAVPGQYIVVLEDRADTAAAADARQTARGHGGQVLQRFDRALNGFSARLPQRAVQALQERPGVAFIEADQGDVIRKILEHCGIWEDPPSRGPAGPGCGPGPVRSMPDADAGISYEVDPDFLEHARRAAACGGVSGGISAGEQAELPWEA